VSNGAVQIVHVDRLLPCVSQPAIGDEIEDELDTSNLTMKLIYPMRHSRRSQDCLRMPHSRSFKTHSLDTQEPVSQVPDTQDQVRKTFHASPETPDIS